MYDRTSPEEPHKCARVRWNSPIRPNRPLETYRSDESTGNTGARGLPLTDASECLDTDALGPFLSREPSGGASCDVSTTKRPRRRPPFLFFFSSPSSLAAIAACGRRSLLRPTTVSIENSTFGVLRLVVAAVGLCHDGEFVGEPHVTCASRWNSRIVQIGHLKRTVVPENEMAHRSCVLFAGSSQSRRSWPSRTPPSTSSRTTPSTAGLSRRAMCVFRESSKSLRSFFSSLRFGRAIVPTHSRTLHPTLESLVRHVYDTLSNATRKNFFENLYTVARARDDAGAAVAHSALRGRRGRRRPQKLLLSQIV